MRLVTTSDLLRINLVGVPASPLEVVIAYDDMTTTNLTPGLQATSVSGSGNTTILASPAASTTRDVSKFTLHNPNTSDITSAKITYYNGASTFTLWTGTLLAGGGLQYNKNATTPWTSIAATGRVLEQNEVDRKVLAQTALPATTLTDVYTVPTGSRAELFAVTITNRGNVNRTFRLSIAVNGAVDGTSQYVYYDTEVGGNETFFVDGRFPLNAGDKVRAYASAATLTINLFGTELS